MPHYLPFMQMQCRVALLYYIYIWYGVVTCIMHIPLPFLFVLKFSRALTFCPFPKLLKGEKDG